MKGMSSSFSGSENNLFSLTKTPAFVKIIAFSFLSLSLFIIIRSFSSDGVSGPNPTIPSQKFPMSFASTPTPSPPAGMEVERTGIIDENGVMTNDFVVGEFDEEVIDTVVDGKNGSDEGSKSDENRGVLRGKIGKFKVCDESMRDYIPCLDYMEGISRSNSSKNGGILERHFPPKGKGWDCLVPWPKDYKLRIPWPKSRDEVLDLGLIHYYCCTSS